MTVAEARQRLARAEAALATEAAKKKGWLHPKTDLLQLRINALHRAVDRAGAELVEVEVAELLATARPPANGAKKPRGRVACSKKPRLRGCSAKMKVTKGCV